MYHMKKIYVSGVVIIGILLIVSVISWPISVSEHV